MSAFHALSAFKATVYYWSALYTWIFRQNRYTDNEHFFAGDVHAHVQVYSLALIFVMWDMPHYRSRSYQQDMLDNLRNVAIPATGIPLSVFCHSWWFCLFFVFFVNPCVCFLGACNKVRVYGGGIQQLWFHYREHLLHPQDWFSFWQLNCRLASFHSQKLRAKGFALEDKWTFLKEGAAAGVPVSPFYTSPRRMVVKNKNIEGGMGIYFFDNAVHGGDYILQAELQNADWLATLLPSRAPLSTLRIITSSSWTMARFGHKIEKKEFKSALALGANDFRDPQKNKHCDSRTGNTCEQNEGPASAFELQSSSANILRNRKKRENVPGKPGSKDEMFSTDQYENISSAEAAKYVTARSAVLRLGRAGASTDHSSVLFDVDIASGAIREGRSNAHWYKLVREVFVFNTEQWFV